MSLYWSQIEGAELQQGDFFPDCLVPYPPENFDIENSGQPFQFQTKIFDLIVLTQTCDLVAGRNKTDWVLLCPVFSRARLIEMEDPSLREKGKGFSSTNKWLSVVKNETKGLFWLPHWDAETSTDDGLTVFYRQQFCLHINYVRRKAVNSGQRRRLNYPYLHGLAQSFGELFTRAALPEPWQQSSQTAVAAAPNA